MANEKIGILFVVALVGALIGGYLGGAFGIGGASSPAGNFKYPMTCYYKTISGDFLAYGASGQNVHECTYVGDNNYDPFNYGQVEYTLLTASYKADLCIPGTGGNLSNATGTFTEYYCQSPTQMIAVSGECDCADNTSAGNTTLQCAGNIVEIGAGSMSFISCTENDGGNNPNILGTTIITHETSAIIKSEFCPGQGNETNTSEFLTEYSCDGDTIISTTGQCTLGCSQGKCIESASVRVCDYQNPNSPVALPSDR
ncbi:MAG: hypothetical protein ABIJ92_01355 [Candidatus Aenigmatarchaeota archaeon]